MKKEIIILILLLTLPLFAHSQRINDNIERGQISVGFGSGDVYNNPFKRNPKDSTNTETVNVPKEIHQWHIDKLFGTVIPTNADTLQHQ